MQTVIEIGGRIVVTDILTESFCCDLPECMGMCCIEGNAGAPLDEDELPVLEREYPRYAPYMTDEGRRTVNEQGVYVIDEEGDYTTPLIAAGADCAYVFRSGGIAMCAIEKAWSEGKTSFRKPVSCHLYPIRVARFRDGSEGLNYHRWDVCAAARRKGKECGTKIYESLKEPLVRKFGEEFYGELEEAARYIDSEELKQQ